MNMTRQMQKGFTLIELMIVVAIIGILAAVGIPQYQDYITKAKASKISTSVDALKLAVAEQYQNGVFPASATPTGLTATGGTVTDWNSWLGISNVPSPNTEVSEVAITDASGAITVTLTDSIGTVAKGKYITWLPVPTGTEVDWVVCTDLAGQTSGAGLIIQQVVAKLSNAPNLDSTNAAYSLSGGPRSSGTYACTANG